MTAPHPCFSNPRILVRDTVKPVFRGHSETKNGFPDRLSLNHRGAFCNTFDSIKLPFVIKIFVLSIFEWPLKTGFTVYCQITA